jgi:hypothetical protein
MRGIEGGRDRVVLGRDGGQPGARGDHEVGRADHRAAARADAAGRHVAVVGRVPEDAARPGGGVVLVAPGEQGADRRPEVGALAG